MNNMMLGRTFDYSKFMVGNDIFSEDAQDNIVSSEEPNFDHKFKVRCHLNLILKANCVCTQLFDEECCQFFRQHILTSVKKLITKTALTSGYQISKKLQWISSC